MIEPVSVTLSVLSLIFLGFGILIQYNCSSVQEKTFRMLSNNKSVSQVVCDEDVEGYSKPLMITIKGNNYDVTRYDHQGEGIKDIYLYDYINKDVTNDFERCHMTDEPLKILENSRKNGEYDGVKYKGNM
jgi:cytochrome b involved in lipid metabolism